jgi:ATP-dependent DNA helicase DinG
VLAALGRLDAAAGELREVHEPGLRVDALRSTAPAAAANPGRPPEPAPAPPPAPVPVPEATRTAVVHGRPWTGEEDEQLREGVELGLTVEDLADHFDCEVPVVAERLSTMGLSAPCAVEAAG